MAYFEEVPGGHRAHIEMLGVRRSKTWPTKRQAKDWAVREEAAIKAGAAGMFPRRTVAEAFTRYGRDVSPKKKGRDKELLRFKAIERDFPELAGKVMHEVTTSDVAAWRDARLKVVAADTVLRDINLLRNVWTKARKEWKWCGASPWTDMDKPPAAPPRTARWRWREVKRMVRYMGYRTGVAPTSKQGEVAYAFLLAQATSMRSSELLQLRRPTVDLERRVLGPLTHKTDRAVGLRYVPIQRRAARLLAVLVDAAKAAGREELFTINDKSRDALFRKVRDALMIEGRRFHDSRADSLTRLSREMDVLTLARVSGHKNIKLLNERYYRETPEEIAARI